MRFLSDIRIVGNALKNEKSFGFSKKVFKKVFKFSFSQFQQNLVFFEKKTKLQHCMLDHFSIFIWLMMIRKIGRIAANTNLEKNGIIIS